MNEDFSDFISSKLKYIPPVRKCVHYLNGEINFYNTADILEDKTMNQLIAATVITAFIVISVKLLRFFSNNSYGNIKKSNPAMPGAGYKLFYSDEKTGNRKQDVIYSKLLKSERFSIQGKPDFIFKGKNTFIPVELKSGNINDDRLPHSGDLMQLVAYFIIIEENFDIAPKEGRIIYNDYMFIIENTKKLRNQLIEVIKDMRLMLKDGENEPSCEYVKCRHCICRGTVCEFCDF